MTNIFLSQLAGAQKTSSFARTQPTTTGGNRSRTVARTGRNGYGLENDGVAVPGENSEPEELIQAEAAVAATDTVLDQHAEAEIDNAGTEVAIEALRHTMASSLRSAFALEDLAEQLEGTLEDGGEGVDETTAQLLNTAIEPSAGADSIATESFGRNSRIATESMIDTVRDKAKNYYQSVASTITNVIQTTSQLIRSAIDGFSNSQKIMADMKSKLGVLESHAGTEITNEVQLKQLKQYFAGMTGDANAAILNLANKSLPAMVNGANSMYEALGTLVNGLTSGDTVDEKTLGREAKRFFDMARKFADRAPSCHPMKAVVPEAYDLSTLSSPETAKSNIDSPDVEDDSTAVFKIINEGIFTKFEDALNNASESMKTLVASTSKKAQLGSDIIKSGTAKASKEEAEDSVQMRRAVANVLMAANMICRDAAAHCKTVAVTCDKGILMIVRASLRMAAMASKAASKAEPDASDTAAA